MAQITQKIDILGRREAASLATNTTQRAFASLGAAVPARRQAVSLNNLDPAAELWVTLAPSGAAAPTVSSSDNDAVVPPRTTRTFSLGSSIELWLRSSSSGAVAYTALELL